VSNTLGLKAAGSAFRTCNVQPMTHAGTRLTLVLSVCISAHLWSKALAVSHASPPSRSEPLAARNAWSSPQQTFVLITIYDTEVNYRLQRKQPETRRRHRSPGSVPFSWRWTGVAPYSRPLPEGPAKHPKFHHQRLYLSDPLIETAMTQPSLV
jgi:hypothetical protein